MSTEYFNPPRHIYPREMRMRDVVSMVCRDQGDGRPWQFCIVKNVTDAYIELYRPYAVSEDFSTTSGVICYMGLEQYRIEKESHVEYLLFERPAAAR